MSGLIVIEGIDGTGKSTLAQALAEALRAGGDEVVVSAEPTRRSPEGRRLRALAAEGREGVTVDDEIELFVADRRWHLEHVVEPALRAGRIVILDRYYYSTMAYQGARGADPEAILKRHRAFAPEPDLLVLLDLPVVEALARITDQRGSTLDAFEGREYLERVRAVFDTIQHPRLLRLDARAPTPELVTRVMDAWRTAP